MRDHKKELIKMAWRNLNTKKARLEWRQREIDDIKKTATDFDLIEYPEAACIVVSYSRGQQLYAVIYDGDAAKPYSWYRYRSEEYRAKTIADHVNNRTKSLQARADYKKANKGTLSGVALTAKVIRDRLKEEFPGVKFSVTSDRFSMGNSVDIHWTDGPITNLVDRIVNRYQQGRFDGMTDCYNYHKIDEAALGCPGAKYVHTSRDLSPERKAEIEAHCIAKTGCECATYYQYGDGVWQYEINHPDCWPAQYQQIKAANDAADIARRERERAEELAAIAAEEKQKQLDSKVVDLAAFREVKSLNAQINKAKSDFLKALPFISNETAARLRDALTKGSEKDFFAAFDIVMIEAGIKKLT